MSVLALVAKAAEEHDTGTHRGSKGKWKPGSGYESEIVSRLSTLCISMDRRLQALEDRATYVCIIKIDSVEKDVLTLRAAWREDEKQRKEEHETDESKPRRNHSRGRSFRSVVAEAAV